MSALQAASQLEVISTISQSSTGSVHFVRDGNGKVFAQKTILKKAPRVGEGAIRRNAYMERNCLLLGTEKDPVLYLLLAWQTADALHLLLPAARATLDDVMKLANLNEEQAVGITRNGLEALLWLHERSIMHRDVKPHNLFLLGDRLVIGDFGSAAGINDDLDWSCLVGTLDYLAPEMLRVVEEVQRDACEVWYGVEVDYWSFGCVLFEILTGSTPLYRRQINETYQAIRNSKYGIDAQSIAVSGVSKGAQEVLRKLLSSQNERTREGFLEKVLSCAWFEHEQDLPNLPPILGQSVSVKCDETNWDDSDVQSTPGVKIGWEGWDYVNPDWRLKTPFKVWDPAASRGKLYQSISTPHARSLKNQIVSTQVEALVAKSVRKHDPKQDENTLYSLETQYKQIQNRLEKINMLYQSLH